MPRNRYALAGGCAQSGNSIARAGTVPGRGQRNTHLSPRHRRSPSRQSPAACLDTSRRSAAKSQNVFRWHWDEVVDQRNNVVGCHVQPEAWNSVPPAPNQLLTPAPGEANLLLKTYLFSCYLSRRLLCIYFKIVLPNALSLFWLYFNTLQVTCTGVRVVWRHLFGRQHKGICLYPV